jgi:hypothetical protein
MTMRTLPPDDPVNLFRGYKSPDGMQSRDASVIAAEHRVAQLAARGFTVEAIAADLGLPRAVVAALVERNAPAPRIRRS